MSYNYSYRKRRTERSVYKSRAKGRRTAHVVVYAKEGEHPDRIIKRFLKKCKKEKIIDQVRKRKYYEKPSVKRHRAKLRKKALIKKEAEENKL